MKLSQMSTDKALDCLAALTPYIEKLIEDEEILDIFKSKKAENEAQWLFGLKRMLTILPQIIGKHKETVFGIVSVVSGRTLEEVAEQSIITTLFDFKEIVNDKDLIIFFTSSAASAQSE